MQSSPPPRQLLGNVWDSVPVQQQPFQQHSLPVSYPQTGASKALALSIVSLVGGLLLFPLCGLLSIPGIAMANNSLRITDQMPGHPDASSAKAAKIIGWIVVTLMSLVVASLVLFFGIVLFYSY